MLEHQLGGKGLERVSVFDSASPLGHLQMATALLARATGFSEADLVAYVLLGPRRGGPRVPGARLRVTPLQMTTLPDGTSLSREQAVIELYARDVNDEDLRRIRRDLRQSWRGPQKGLSDSRMALIKVMKKKGPPSRWPGGRGKYWSRVHAELNRLGYFVETTTKAVEVAYGRLPTDLRPFRRR